MDRKAGLSSDGEALDDAARRAHQTDLLRNTVEMCWESSDFYRSKLEHAGLKPADIRDVEDLALIPVTLKKVRSKRFQTTLGNGKARFEHRAIEVLVGPA